MSKENKNQKKARTNVESHDDQHVPNTCQVMTTDDEHTSVTRTYAQTEGDRVSIPDQDEVNAIVAELLHDGQNKFLTNISQKYALKENCFKLLQNKQLAAILEIFLLEELSEKKLIPLLKTYHKPENWDYNLIPHRNFEIWSVHLASRERDTYIFLLKILLHMVKACDALFTACDKLLLEKI